MDKLKNPLLINDINNYHSINNYSVESAFECKNRNVSINLHDSKDNESYHNTYSSDKVKSMIFGGLDGIITLFAITVSCHAGNLEKIKIITVCVSSMIAGAISMGHGDYFSEKAEQDYINNQYKREQWEMDNYIDGELNEMVQLYKLKYQVKENDASNILNEMLKYPKLFLDHMMVIELGLLPPDDENNPIINGIITFMSFIFFGSIPLISYLISNNIYISSGFSLITLGILGTIKAWFTHSNMCYSCLITMVNGILSAGMAYFVTFLIMKYQ